MKFGVVLAEIAAAAHEHLREGVLIRRSIPAEEVFQEYGFLQRGICDDLFIGG